MGILDQVTEMRKQGLNEAEMSARLQEQGISPKAIRDAFNQEKIKSAVSAEDTTMQNYNQNQEQNPSGTFYRPRTQEQPINQEYYENNEQVPGLPGDPASYQNPYQDQNYQDYQNPYAQQNYPQTYPQQPLEEYYSDPNQNQGFYPQDPYAQEQEGYYQDSYSAQGSYNTDTIIEISEQVFAEKIKKIERQVEKFGEFAALAQTKITDNNERIKRIESIIDKLQITILEKIGSYGKDIQTIKKEMEMIEDSFSKVVPELRKHKKKTSSKSSKK